MTFLHPWIVWLGVAAAALPIAVHLLTRPRPVRMPLSTVRFVREAIRQRRARHRLRDIIILVLRTAAIALLALAVARPRWGERPLISDRQSGDAVRVVILDVSQSMAATHGGVQAMERARTRAAGYLRYRSGLRANLIFAAARPEAVFENPSSNLDALRDELARCKALPQRLDVNRALAAAAQMLVRTSENDQRRRELVVVSDFQRENWGDAHFQQIPEYTQIQLESVAPSETSPNVALLRANCQARHAQRGGLHLQIDVGNYSSSARKVTAEVVISGATYRLAGHCPAGGRTTLTEEITRHGTGWQWGEVRLVGVDDALAADDVRPLVVQVRERPVYALVTRQPESLRPSSSHFLECALVPDKRLGKNASANLVRVNPAGMDRQSLAAADLILLDHCGRLSEENIKLLAGLMRRGRPIIYVAAEVIDATNLKRLADAAGGGLQLPVQFTPPHKGQFRRNLVLKPVRGDHPPFDRLGESLLAFINRQRFNGGLSSQISANAREEEMLATYADGTACMVLTPSDAGTLAVVNADLAASDITRTEAFNPLVDELVQEMMASSRAEESFVCGEQLVKNLPPEAGTAAELRIVGPAAMDRGEGTDRFGELADRGIGTVWHWPSPEAPAAYRIQRGDVVVYSAAVTIPSRESNLNALPSSVLKDRLAAGRDVYYRSISGEGDRRDDLWKWFVAACVVCMLAEIGTLLAFRT